MGLGLLGDSLRNSLLKQREGKRIWQEVERAKEEEKTNTALIKHSESKSERYAQRARKGEMEFLEENNFAHLLSLINIEMNPLRRRSLPLPERRVESSQSLKGALRLSDLPRQGTPF